MLESRFSATRREAYEHAGANIFVVTGSLFQKAGQPDWWIGHRFFAGWLELKVDKNPCSPVQKLVIRKIRASACPAFVYRYVSDIDRETLELEDGGVLKVFEPDLPALEKLKLMKESWELWRAARSPVR